MCLDQIMTTNSTLIKYLLNLYIEPNQSQCLEDWPMVTQEAGGNLQLLLGAFQ